MSCPVFIDLRDSFESTKNMYICGSWNSWTGHHPISNIVILSLHPGIYQFKCYELLEDGSNRWTLLPYSIFPTILDPTSGEINDTLMVKEISGGDYTVEYDSYKFVGKNRSRINGQLYINNILCYEGEMPSGNMIMYNETGGIYYEGETVDFIRHGTGICCDTDRTYDGEWNNDYRMGKGTQHVTDGTIYDGEWDLDMYNGKGILTTSEGEYEGEFKNGRKYGLGIFKGKELEYKGQWKNDLYDGKGLLTTTEGEYEGEFKNGYKHGNGKMTYKNGSFYSGEWKDNLPNGSGVFKNDNGTLTEGIFKNGLPHGFVKVYKNDKLVYRGAQAYGYNHGLGISYENGNEYIDKFEFGKALKMYEPSDKLSEESGDLSPSDYVITAFVMLVISFLLKAIYS